MKSFTSVLLLVSLALGCKTNQPVSPRFNHVVLHVTNLDSSIKFYTTAFDLNVTNRVSSAVFIDSTGQEKTIDVPIAFLKFPNQDFVYEMVQVKADKSKHSHSPINHIGVDVQDIDAALARVQQAGATLVRPIETVKIEGMSVKHCFLKGPDGELLELMQVLTGEF